ncbi:heavy metal-associated isoprenylated plant protein 4 [Dendrobium catenatum]|uniref:Heavy metal-associated isoprenylated plant protein 26 n=1 Tax=Dendrobium catenatum TaxID=906689 RepID=A0A2I0VBF3_9ASPA|nr:heavy metal-associated isoprenylated plant protein 4 [Dendrobium catenatum]PKU60744.1 Heavy metal-associated isoprenylated plant protein 26 [Dendrobium catenatum]
MTSGVQQAHYACQHGELFEPEDYELVAAMIASERKEQVESKAKEKVQVITAIYKLNLHCNECGRAIEKPIIRTQGVENVYIDVESGKVTVTGIFDAKKMHELIKKKSKKKVEWISFKPEDKGVRKEEIVGKMRKEEVVKTAVIKLHLHCEKCENDLENKLLKLRGVHSVKIDRGEQTCTVVGIVEEEKLIEYIHKKAGKRGEIVQQKVKKIKEDESEKKEEVKSKDVAVPYFIHCTHAPQWFSDENPNSCSVM